jgi:hypothetical protein
MEADGKKLTVCRDQALRKISKEKIMKLFVLGKN